MLITSPYGKRQQKAISCRGRVRQLVYLCHYSLRMQSGGSFIRGRYYSLAFRARHGKANVLPVSSSLQWKVSKS